jgi:3,4-dihydroxy 2-butanone 4-phosphate synthase/GTP cyclohydrolase II
MDGCKDGQCSAKNASPFTPIPEALKYFSEGGILIVMDDEDRENEGDLIMAAEHATAAKVAFIVKHTTGYLCAPMPAERAAELNFDLMVKDSTDPNKTAYTVSCDSVDTSTGVSGHDRATTFKQLADPTKKANSFRRPGHVLPLIAKPNGVWERRGHTEATVDLCKLSGVQPVGIIGELVNDDEDGTMMRLPDCIKFAEEHNLKLITIEQLLAYRLETEPNLKDTVKAPIKGVELIAQCELPVSMNGEDLGHFTQKMYYSHFDGRHHSVLERGDITREPYDPVLLRVHSECFTGDVFGSQRCDCREQLYRSIKMVSERGRGVVIYNVGQEGRGIGLVNKVKAYNLQQTKKMDTYQANHALGFGDDLRNYDTARAIIEALGIKKVQLMTSNSTKTAALGDLVVSTVPLEGTYTPHNHAYLDAKRKKLGLPVIVSPPRSESPSPVNVAEASVNVNTKSIKSAPVDHPIIGNVESLRIGIVRTMWNNELLDPFVGDVKLDLLKNGVLKHNIIEVVVPGCFDLPWAAKRLAPRVDAVANFGLLLKGQTTHFEMVSEASAKGLMDISISTGVPMVDGIFTCLTENQAKVRLNPDSKLATSLAVSTLHMASLNRHDFKSIE